MFLLPTLLLAQAPTLAQAGDVTFSIPLDLKRLHSNVTRVAITCTITSNAFASSSKSAATATGRVELPVTGGEVVTTATVVVAVPSLIANPTGHTADYRCELEGWDTGRDPPRTLPANTWGPFSGAIPSMARDARLLWPPPPVLSGSFYW